MAFFGGTEPLMCPAPNARELKDSEKSDGSMGGDAKQMLAEFAMFQNADVATPLAERVTIGKMIEFLLYKKKFFGLRTHDPKGISVFCGGDILFEKPDDICDKLWEATKKVLE